MGGFHIEPGVSSIALRQVLFRAPGFGETILYRQVLKFAKRKCQEYWFCAGLDKTKEIRRSANYHGRTIELCSSLTEARALPFSCTLPIQSTFLKNLLNYMPGVDFYIWTEVTPYSKTSVIYKELL